MTKQALIRCAIGPCVKPAARGTDGHPTPSESLNDPKQKLWSSRDRTKGRARGNDSRLSESEAAPPAPSGRGGTSGAFLRRHLPPASHWRKKEAEQNKHLLLVPLFLLRIRSRRLRRIRQQQPADSACLPGQAVAHAPTIISTQFTGPHPQPLPRELDGAFGNQQPNPALRHSAVSAFFLSISSCGHPLL